MKGTILLAEDDDALSFVIKDSLEEVGYKVVSCGDGEAAIEQFQQKHFDICLLDVNMPLKDGFAVAKKIRQLTEVTPIIFITAKSQEEDKIKGFSTGADDYVTKPFSMQELIMRIEVFLKRTRKIKADNIQEFHIGKLRFHYSELKILNEENVATLLTQKEAELLKFFALHPNKILKRDEVLLHVWGKDDYFLGRSMDVFITKLRKLLKPDESIMIETLHGVGFRLNTPPPKG
ncbi:MAG: response regulator transcription factor [Ferruginibacter sp.]